MRKIQVLGVGCPKCRKLAANVAEVVKTLDERPEIEKIEDVRRIAEFGVMMTPALVVDGEILSVGRVLSVEELKTLLKSE